MKRKSDARAQGTNPRFPWKPSAAMLTFRLVGTTGAIGVDRDGQPPVSSPPPTTARGGRGMNLRPPRCAEDARLLTCTNGAGDRSRTRDILITSEALYQLSYTGDAAGTSRDLPAADAIVGDRSRFKGPH